jgi:hypothetical protein
VQEDQVGDESGSTIFKEIESALVGGSEATDGALGSGNEG